MGSTRLPNKSLLPLAGMSLVGRILERVRLIQGIHETVLAIPNSRDNDALELLARDYGVMCFRGSENDLVDRYYKAALEMDADYILRLPADNPCSEPSEFERLIRYHPSSGNDFSSNICHFMGNGYPDGIGVEMFDIESLTYIWENEQALSKREHVALNYYDYVNDRYPSSNFNFKVGTIKCPDNYSRPDICLDINTESDYLFIEKLHQYLSKINREYDFSDVIAWFDKQKKQEEV